MHPQQNRHTRSERVKRNIVPPLRKTTALTYSGGGRQLKVVPSRTTPTADLRGGDGSFLRAWQSRGHLSTAAVSPPQILLLQHAVHALVAVDDLGDAQVGGEARQHV